MMHDYSTWCQRFLAIGPRSVFSFISTPFLSPCRHPFRTFYLVPNLLIAFTPLSQHVSPLPRIPQFCGYPAQLRELRGLLSSQLCPKTTWAGRRLCVTWLIHLALYGTVLVLKLKVLCPRNLLVPDKMGQLISLVLWTSENVIREAYKGVSMWKNGVIQVTDMTPKVIQ